MALTYRQQTLPNLTPAAWRCPAVHGAERPLPGRAATLPAVQRCVRRNRLLRALRSGLQGPTRGRSAAASDLRLPCGAPAGCFPEHRSRPGAQRE